MGARFSSGGSVPSIRGRKLSAETADHVYPHVVKWIDRDRLLFVTMGHDGIDARGFTLSYLYDLRNNTFTLLEFDHDSEGGFSTSFRAGPQPE
jgi:hypothetical protein